MSESAVSALSAEPAPRWQGELPWIRFKQNKPAVVGAWVLALILLVLVAWPVLLHAAPWFGPKAAAFAERFGPDHLSDDSFQGPSLRHWFGTDVHGRDQFSRVVYGARISLLVGFVGAGVSLVIGVLWGAIAGYAGGKIDGFLMRSVDALYSMPSIILVIVLVTTMENGFRQVLARFGAGNVTGSARLLFLFFGLGAVSWLTMARIVRGQVLSLRQRPFVEASRALGAGPVHILARHILPNIMGVVIVYLTLTVPAVVLYESFLSYLGLGIQPPMASWGSLIAEGAEQMNPIRIYWWLIVFPGASLVVALLAFNLVGDGLRDAWDAEG